MASQPVTCCAWFLLSFDCSAGIIVNNWQHKYDIVPKDKNSVEIDSLLAYIKFSCKFYKLLYLICQANWSRGPKITYRDPFEAATHRLRSPALYHRPMVNNMKTSFA